MSRIGQRSSLDDRELAERPSSVTSSHSIMHSVKPIAQVAVAVAEGGQVGKEQAPKLEAQLQRLKTQNQRLEMQDQRQQAQIQRLEALVEELQKQQAQIAALLVREPQPPGPPSSLMRGGWKAGVAGPASITMAVAASSSEVRGEVEDTLCEAHPPDSIPSWPVREAWMAAHPDRRGTSWGGTPVAQAGGGGTPPGQRPAVPGRGQAPART